MPNLITVLKKMTPYRILRFLEARYLMITHPGIKNLGHDCSLINTSTGKNINIAANVHVINSSIGDCSYIGEQSRIVNATVGKYCSIASEVCIGLGQHPAKKYVSTHPVFYLSNPRMGWQLSAVDCLVEHEKTTVGHDVWLGLRAAVRDGVTIGDGAIIAAGAVVVSDVEPYAVYGGVPAKLIRYRFNEKQIQSLLALKWWDKDATWFKHNLGKMHDIDLLMSSLDMTATGPAN